MTNYLAIAAFVVCWLILPLYTQGERHWQLYPHSGYFRCNHGWGFLCGLLAAGFVWLVG